MANIESRFFVIGEVKWKKTKIEKYGPRTDMMIRLMKTTMPEMTKDVIVVAWRDLSGLAEQRPKGSLVYIKFDQHDETNWKGRTIVKVKAKAVEPCSKKVLDALSINKDGLYDPAGTMYLE